MTTFYVRIRAQLHPFIPPSTRPSISCVLQEIVTFGALPFLSETLPTACDVLPAPSEALQLSQRLGQGRTITVPGHYV